MAMSSVGRETTYGNGYSLPRSGLLALLVTHDAAPRVRVALGVLVGSAFRIRRGVGRDAVPRRRVPFVMAGGVGGA